MRTWQKLVLVSSLLAGGVAAGAGGKAKPVKPPEPACGMHYMPIVPGNFWTYRSGDLQLTVKIVAVSDGGKNDKGDPVSKIDVEEQTPKINDKTDGPVVKTQWTCTAKDGLVIPPESFMFAGETGTMHGMTFDVKSHTGVSIAPDASFVKDTGWDEKVLVDVTRTDTGGDGITFPPAKLELSRATTIHPEEEVVCPANGAHLQALRATYELRGTVSIEGLEKPSPLPVKRYTDEKNKELVPPGMWFVKDVGVLKYQDAYDKDWELYGTNVNLPF